MADPRPKIPRPGPKGPDDTGHGSGTHRASLPAAPRRAPQKTLLGIPGPSGARPSRMPSSPEPEVIPVAPPPLKRPPPRVSPDLIPPRNRRGASQDEKSELGRTAVLPPQAEAATKHATGSQRARQDLGKTAVMPAPSSMAFDRTLVLPNPGATPALTPAAALDPAPTGQLSKQPAGDHDANAAETISPPADLAIADDEPTRVKPVPIAALRPTPISQPREAPAARARGMELKLPPLGDEPRPAADDPEAFDDEAPTRRVDLQSLAREKSGARRKVPSVPDGTDEPAVLLVGFSDELHEALTEALGRQSVFVETAELGNVVPTVTVAAPDLVVLMGDGGRAETRALLDELASSPLSSVVPVALVTDDPDLGARLAAFRHGAAAVIPKSASVSTLAERISELVREIPERREALGRVGEATLNELVDTLAHELRSGILSVKQEGEREGVRLVLGRGRPLATLIDEFVTRVRSQIEVAEPLLYEFDERAMGTVELLATDLEDDLPAADVSGLRVILADDDSARADAVAQELRARGAQVVVTDLEPSRAHFGRLRQLDPMVLVIGDTQLQGAGYHLVKMMREHRRLRWASLLVVHWDELWSEERGVPNTSVLLNRLAGLAEPERLIATRLSSQEAFDTRLEALGPARLVRALTTEQALRVTVRNPRYYVQVSIAQSLVAGAVGFTQAGARLEGPQALAALLNIGSGRVHVEPGRASNATNLMSTVDVALGLAESEEAPIPESIPAPPPSDLPPALPRIATQPAGLNSTQLLEPTVASFPGVTPGALAAPGLPGTTALPVANAGLPHLSDGSDESVTGPTSLRPPAKQGLSRRHKLMIGVGAAMGSLCLLLLVALLVGGESKPEPQVLASVPLQKEEPASAAESSRPLEPRSAAEPGRPEAAESEKSAAPAGEAEPPAAPHAERPAGANADDAKPATSAEGEAKTEPEDKPRGSSAPSTADSSLPAPQQKKAKSCKQALAAQDPEAGGKGAALREIERGKRMIIAGDLVRSQQAYCQALVFSPEETRAMSGLGLVLMMLGDGEQATDYLERAISEEVDDTRQLLGDALALSGRYAEAKTEWLKAAGIEPDDAAQIESLAHINQTKADQSFRQRNYPRAERLYRRAVVLSPRRVEAAAGLARVLVKWDRKQEALRWAKRVVAQRPKSGSYWVLLGDIQAELGDKASAKDAYTKALEVQPNNREAQARLR
ncbi:MAG: tetratricopeptide repeat protein [Polyangiaceae bacterium]